MYRGACVAVVMPAYNVEAQVVGAMRAVPTFVDYVIVVDDASTDGTARALGAIERSGIVRMRHLDNRGVGAAIATGYRQALALGADIAAVMAGDGQMDPCDLAPLLDPIVDGRADYAKGNRFAHPSVWRAMPLARLAGNLVLSVLTKLSSGYLRVFDSQCGYTAASRGVVAAVADRLYPRYGYPNALLARLRMVGARVVDVAVRPVYAGERSGIRFWTFFYPILYLMLRSLGERLWSTYGKPASRGRIPAPVAWPAALSDQRHQRYATHAGQSSAGVWADGGSPF